MGRKRITEIKGGKSSVFDLVGAFINAKRLIVEKEERRNAHINRAYLAYLYGGYDDWGCYCGEDDDDSDYMPTRSSSSKKGKKGKKGKKTSHNDGDYNIRFYRDLSEEYKYEEFHSLYEFNEFLESEGIDIDDDEIENLKNHFTSHCCINEYILLKEKRKVLLTDDTYGALWWSNYANIL